MSSVRRSGTCAPSATASATVRSRPSGLRSVRYSSAPCAASRNAVARRALLAAPVIRHRFPAKYAFCAMAVTIPAVPARLASAAAPERVQPQLLEDADPALHVALKTLAADQNRFAAQCQRGGARQAAHQCRDVVGDRIRGPGLHLGVDDVDDLAQHNLKLLLENLANLNIGVTGGITGRHHRVVVCIDRGGAADHPLGELLRRLARLTGGEVLREL